MPQKTESNARRGLVILCIAAFLVPFMGSALNLALPQISTDFGMKAVTLTWLATIYIIATAIFQIPFARLADIHGRKKVFTAGVLVFSVFTLLCGMASSEHMLLVYRFFSGIGSAMMFGTNIAILTSLFPAGSRGRVLGVNAAVVYAALAAGPFLGGLLTHHLGWRSIFLVSACIGFFVFVAALVFLRQEWTEARGAKFDLAGSLLYGTALAGIIYGFTSLPNVRGIVCLIAGIALLVLFVLYERKQGSPVLNVRLFSGNRVFSLSNLAAMINYAATSAIGFMLSLYLQYIRGLDADHAGLILISQAVVQSAFSLIAGSLSNRYAPSALATTGMCIIVAGLAGLIFLGQATPFWIIITLLVLMGVGFGIFSSPNTNVIMSSVQPGDYTQASATTGTMRLTGQAFSMGIAGMAISFYLGDGSIVPEVFVDFMRSMRLTFTVFLLLCIVGVYASTARLRAVERS